MDPDRTFDFLLGDFVLYAGTPAILLFVIFYGVRSDWRRLVAGRSLMYMSIAMLAIMTLAAVTAILGPDFPFRPLIRFVVYAAMSITLWKMFYTLIKIQSSGADQDHLPLHAGRARGRTWKRVKK